MTDAIPPVVQEELATLADVREKLLRAAPERVAKEDETIAELQRIQADIATAKTEDKAALEQQYEHMVRLLEQLRKGRDIDRIDPDSPYFGRLRLIQDERPLEVMLGKTTCLSDGLRIVDWRHAPIARVYYRYQEGDEYEEDLGPRVVEGRVKLRRSVTIAGGQLDRVSSPQGNYLRHGDTWDRLDERSSAFSARPHEPGRFSRGQALRVDKHLPDIAALIDPAQFELISRPDSGPVVIRGGAGSGKTTVALHRVAWLAYQEPRRFAPEKMLVMVWGRALRDYVSRVLPGLGVQGVGVTTWSAWSRRLVERHFPSLPGHDNANTPSVVSRVKLHPELPMALEALVRGRKAAPTPGSALEDWKLLVSDRAILGRLGGVSPEEAFQVVNWSKSQQQQLAMREEREKGAEPWLDEEDDALLLRAWQLRVGPLKTKTGPLRYTHVAVDEVQDFSPMEIAVLLGCCDERRCITLAGDTQQHIQERGGSTAWGDLLEPLGIASTSLSTLRVSYRSTRPISDFARGVLGPVVEDDTPPATVKDGPRVERLGFVEHGACVEALGRALKELMAEEPHASVALISRDAATAHLYFEGLDRMEVPRLRLVQEQEFAFAPGIDVVDVAQVKGLEFDYVVVLDVSLDSWPDRPSVRRLLHVAATRAVHQLWITWIGRPSHLLPVEHAS